MRFKWSKLLMNLGNALEAAVGPIGRRSDLYAAARAEAEAVITAAGIDCASAEEDAERRGDLISLRPDRGRAPRRWLLVAEPGPRHGQHRGRPAERRDRPARAPARRADASERSCCRRWPTSWPAPERSPGRSPRPTSWLASAEPQRPRTAA